MGFLEILYWGASYTTGIACATVFLIHYLQKGDRHSLRLFLFLLPFELSIVCLSLMTGFPGQPALGLLVGRLALVGAALTASAFPTFAMLDTEDDGKRGTARAFRIAGLSFAALNLAVYLMPEGIGVWFQLATLLVLALAIFIGMSWIARGSVSWRSQGKPALMAILFVFFGAVLVVDFFRGLILPLSFLGPRYVLLPAFFAYLNVFLLTSHARQWSREGKDAAAPGPDAGLMDAYGISAREREVLALLASGRTYREIADDLCLSLATIKSHVSHLYEKTGARNKVELINLLYDSKGARANQPKSG
jgi:DNA-binding CsgD family transcriptional regulator